MKDEKIMALSEELKCLKEKNSIHVKNQHILTCNNERNEKTIFEKNKIYSELWSEKEKLLIDSKINRLNEEEINAIFTENYLIRRIQSTEDFRKCTYKDINTLKEKLKEAYIKEEIRSKNSRKLINQLSVKEKEMKSLLRVVEDYKLKCDTLKSIIENFYNEKGIKNIIELDYIKAKDIQIDILYNEIQKTKEIRENEIKDLKEIISLKNLNINELN